MRVSGNNCSLVRGRVFKGDVCIKWEQKVVQDVGEPGSPSLPDVSETSVSEISGGVGLVTLGTPIRQPE